MDSITIGLERLFKTYDLCNVTRSIISTYNIIKICLYKDKLIYPIYINSIYKKHPVVIYDGVSILITNTKICIIKQYFYIRIIN